MGEIILRAASILWQRLDQPGHESARLVFRQSFWQLSGVAVFEHDEKPCRLDYLILCDPEWRTVSAAVEGWFGDEEVDVTISVDDSRSWRLDDEESSRVAGCIDLDLEFSPATNLIPIRRLHLPIGAEARVRSAWLRFPSLELEPLQQLYRRLDDTTYHYESGAFITELKVNRDGLVTFYPDFWEAQV